MKKRLFFFLLFYIFINSANSSFAKTNHNKDFLGCNNKNSKNYYLNFYNAKIKKIEIDTHNYRSWTVNNIRIITSNTRFIPNDLKRKFEATIKVSYESGFFCILKGRVRHSGDAKDHIALKDNSIIQSLDITLDHGNIRGITRFKLFKPDVRGVLEDVVIQSEILRELGYLAPRSVKVQTRVNETESIMLFQEKAAKELLEYNKRREGPILEGDQKFFFELVKSIPDNNLSNWSVGTPTLRNKSSKVMLSKLTNANLVTKGEIHKQISLNAISKLNSIYLYWSNRFQDEKNNFYFFDYDLDNYLLALFDKDKNMKLEMYNLFMQSTNSHHALSASNRKFYWNSIENYFEPIMYDSNPNIDLDFSTTTTAKVRFPISKYYKESYDDLVKLLSDIDIKKIKTQIDFNGLTLSEDSITKKIEKIKKNLKTINDNFNEKIPQDLITHNQYKYKENLLENFYVTLKEINPNTYLIKRGNDQFLKCEIYLKNCESFNIFEENFIRLLEGELEVSNINYQFIGNNIDLKSLNLNDNYNFQRFLNTDIFYDKDISLEIDQAKKIIVIDQKEIGARAYLINGSLNGASIIFNGVGISENNNPIPPKFPFDMRGLTGCLSFINLNVKDINVKASNSNCEDAVNFINSSGSVNKILINNSFSDALDVDFSDLKIQEINISTAKNDCTDFSYGNYVLKNLKVNNCGDKGISIGETSKVDLEEIEVNNVNVGIATKDSSILRLEKGTLSNLSTCFAAYNKKQEFSGGFVEINEVDCKNFSKKFDQDDMSQIVYLGKN